MKLEQHDSAGQAHWTRFDEDGRPVSFPTSRYFQIHLEYLDTRIDEVRRMLQELHVQLGELTQRMATDTLRDHRESRRPGVEAAPRKAARPRNAVNSKQAPPRS